jgi:hypothetical protein
VGTECNSALTVVTYRRDRVYNLIGTSEQVQDLLHHEFGHILQYRQPYVGSKFYSVIVPESAASAYLDGKVINPFQGYALHDHAHFWTETWANKLSMNYFGSGVFNNQYEFRGEEIGLFNLMKFFRLL